jgi:NADH-quinone oxidoreductase subunit J
MLIEIAFLAVGAWILISAIMVLMTRELVHAAVWLASMMVGVAGIFITLGAEFLATIQILVYVGAVITLILFTVMLTVPEERIDFLDELELPPGVQIESVQEIQKAIPTFGGVGPYKDLDTTNPRRPLRKPPTLYGVTLADNEYGSDQTDRSKEAKP